MRHLEASLRNRGYLVNRWDVSRIQQSAAAVPGWPASNPDSGSSGCRSSVQRATARSRCRADCETSTAVTGSDRSKRCGRQRLNPQIRTMVWTESHSLDVG